MKKILLPFLVCVALFYLSVSRAEEGHNHKKEKHIASSTGAEDKHEDEENSIDFIGLSDEKAQKSGISTSEVIASRSSRTLILPGEISINGDSIVHVAPRFEGILKRVGKHIGEVVQRGDILATVQSNESLSVYQIKAESDGLVIDKDASLGEFVNNNKILFTIADFDIVWVNAAVYVSDLEFIQAGLSATVRSKTNDTTQVGTIGYLRPTLNEATRTALARIVLQNPKRKWFPGMFVNVHVELPSQGSRLLIPSESAVFINNEYVAFIKATNKNGKQGFVKKDISIGYSDGTQVEVLAGLKQGEVVASGETFILKAELGKSSAEHSH